jgi:predicted nuclease with TOPRIM domain
VADGGGDAEYVRLREYYADRERANARMSDVELEQAKIRASLMHLPDKIEKLADKIDGLRKPESDLSAASAIHRIVDTFERGRSPSSPSVVTLAAMLGCTVVGGWVVHFVAEFVK